MDAGAATQRPVDRGMNVLAQYPKCLHHRAAASGPVSDIGRSESVGDVPIALQKSAVIGL